MIITDVKETERGYNIYLKYKGKALVHRYFNKRMSLDEMKERAKFYEKYIIDNKKKKNKKGGIDEQS